MKKHAFAAGAIALLLLGTLALPAQASPYGYDNRATVVPPPPPRGYVMTPGYRYVQPAPHGYGHDTRWEYRRRWGDRDHDGIPNRYDRDRDGDGVPNRYDRRPDNPYRY
ncbi:hypothetical protein WKW77_16190 [Variovorax ureilyticus]|uniref:PXPV repeat-containing protein n=1 Tax=Variovorax ureilyticus TaxID=1836198 RepID=A0ABU8VH52_9BURK